MINNIELGLVLEEITGRKMVMENGKIGSSSTFIKLEHLGINSDWEISINMVKVVVDMLYLLNTDDEDDKTRFLRLYINSVLKTNLVEIVERVGDFTFKYNGKYYQLVGDDVICKMKLEELEWF